MDLIKLAVPVFLLINPNVRKVAVYTTGDHLAVIFSEDDTPKWGWLKHFSVSRHDRYPSWDEILAVKEKLMGDIDCMMVLPKQEDYVNLHTNCFHIWQTPEKWGLR